MRSDREPHLVGENLSTTWRQRAKHDLDKNKYSESIQRREEIHTDRSGFFASTVVNAQHGLDSKEEKTLKRIETGEEIAP